jgi:hypothetical protein
MVNDQPYSASGRGFRLGKLGLTLTGSYLGYQVQSLFLKPEESCGGARTSTSKPRGRSARS